MADPDLADLENRAHRHLVERWTEPRPPGHADVVELLAELAPLLAGRSRHAVANAVVARAGGFGRLDALLADGSVSEVMVNGCGPVWIERGGRLEPTELTLSRAEVDSLIARVLAPLGRTVDRSSPLVDARMADGSRVNVVVPPLALDGPQVTIRRFRTAAVDLGEFCPPGVHELLKWAVEARLNVLVSGATGAGKTTFLNALGALVPPCERIVTIEDTAELRLPGDHVVRLESRPGDLEGLHEVTVRDLVRNALRMRPDRIVVGEVRGPEALDMLQAMNTGHDGSLSTCHANSPADALFRIETMVLMGNTGLPLTAVRRHMAAAIDLVVGLERDRGGTRRVVGVAEVIDGADACGLRDLAGSDGLIHLPRRAPRARSCAPASGAWLSR
jgi:pilus assembly protein CpaF